MKLTKKQPASEPFEFSGDMEIVIVGGVGTLTLERSLTGSDFYPLSVDISGSTAKFELNGKCAYNGTLSSGAGARYRFVAELEEGEVDIILKRGK